MLSNEYVVVAVTGLCVRVCVRVFRPTGNVFPR